MGVAGLMCVWHYVGALKFPERHRLMKLSILYVPFLSTLVFLFMGHVQLLGVRRSGRVQVDRYLTSNMCSRVFPLVSFQTFSRHAAPGGISIQAAGCTSVYYVYIYIPTYIKMH